MPTPPRSDEQKASVRDRIEAKLREGFRPPGLNGQGPAAINEAAREAVAQGEFTSANTFDSAARDLRGTEWEPDWGLYRAQRYSQPVPLSVLQPAVPHLPAEPSGRPQRILAIGDLHQDPRHPDRLPIMTWLGRLASDPSPRAHHPDRRLVNKRQRQSTRRQ